ncbi:MAG: oligopeptide/dipeptide ABC transporter ATP-binding protein, partial [Cyanobacteria bacterium P01_C01_bin.147]
EAGPVEQVFNNPCHPYTEALISAIPSFAAKPRPIPLTGEPRSPINPDSQVCRLYGRCPKGEDTCQQAMPTLAEITPDHWAACHFHN